MASLIRSGSFLKIVNGFRRSLASNVPRCDALTLHKSQTFLLHTSITRSLAVQRPNEYVRSGGQTRTQGVDKALFRIDTDIRRTGRIFIKDIQHIFKEIKTLKYASSQQSLLLLRCCGSMVPEERPEVRNKLVQEIWETLHTLNIPLDVSHYNTLLRVYLENNHKFSPTEFLADLEGRQIEPNRVTYQRLIARYCQDGDIEGATKILEYMKEKQLPVGENIFHALIMGHARAKDLESAHGILKVMQSSGLEPTTETYMNLLISYAEAGHLEEMEKTLEEAKLADLILYDRELMEVILALAKGGHATQVMEMLERLQKGQGFNQDAMNLIYRLLNAGCHQMGYLVFQSMGALRNVEGETVSMGSFLIKHLVKCGTDLPTIVHYCHELKREGFNSWPMETALGTALMNEQPTLAVALLRVMVEDKAEIRSHYFWPIITYYGRCGEIQKVYETVGEMVTLETPLTLETFQKYVVPAVIGEEEGDDGVVAGLREVGVSVPMAVNSVVAYYLDSNNLAKAANLVKKYRCRVKPVMRRNLATAFLKTRDANSAVVIVGQMFMINQETDKEVETLGREEEGKDEEMSQEEEDSKQQGAESRQQDIAGLFVLDVLFQQQRDGVKGDVEPLLREMVERGVSISRDSVEVAKKRLVGEEATETVLNLLDTLTSGNLTYQPLRMLPRESYSQQSVANLEQRLVSLENKNLPTSVLLVNLLQAVARNGDLERAEEIMKKLESDGYPYSTGLYALVIDMYTKAGQVEKASEILREMMDKQPDSRLIPSKYLRLAQLMAQTGLIDEAIELIKSQSSESPESPENQQEPGAIQVHARRVLDQPAEKGDVVSTRRLLDALLATGITKPSNLILSPLIKAYLVKDDLDGALEEFKKLCEEHRVTPNKMELTAKCIDLEDGARLQKILDLSIQVHGEVNSLYDMVFSFIEANRVNQARKLIDTPGLRAYNEKLDRVCFRYCETNQVTCLENLVAVTRNLFDVDRNMMYKHLLMAYKKLEDPDKALGIWTTMQEENIQPSESFLHDLGVLLRNNGREIPFIIPEKAQATSIPKPQDTPPSPSTEVSKTQPLTQVGSSAKGDFRRKLRSRDLTAALELKKQIEESGGQLSITEKSELIEALVQANQVAEAAELTRQMLASGIYPQPRVLKFTIIALAKAGDFDTLTSFDKYLSENIRRRVSFSNYLADSHRVAVGWQAVVESLRTRLKEAQDSEMSALVECLPKGSIMGILQNNPDALAEVTILSEEYAARGVTEVANCLWMHLFCDGQTTEAEEIYKKHLSGSSKLMFRGVLRRAGQLGDPQLVETMMAAVKTHPALNTSAKAYIYSTWIEILSDKKEYSKGLEVLDSALSSMGIEDLGPKSLNKLRDGVERTGSTFPYIIPLKVKKQKPQSSSSSSSDSK